MRETAPQCNLLGASPRVRALPCRVRRVAAPAAAAGGGSPNGPRRVIGGLIRKTVGLLLGSQVSMPLDSATLTACTFMLHITRRVLSALT